jgi:hypothetical protein
MKRIGKTYVIVTNDGPNNENVFLSWTTKDGGYYTTVDNISEIKKCDLHGTVDSAIERANDANSGTLFGWDAHMKVVELLNFDEAYNNNEEPKLQEIVTITFK